MSKVLSRTKSFRLRGYKESNNEVSVSTPVKSAASGSRTDLQPFKPTPSAKDAGSSRPRTAGSDRRQATFQNDALLGVAPGDPASKLTSPSSNTVLYSSSANINADVPIGVALGSPSRCPWDYPLNSPDSETQRSGTVTTIISVDSSARDNDNMQAKPSRWKSLFGRRAPPPRSQEPFYQLERQGDPQCQPKPGDKDKRQRGRAASKSRTASPMPTPVDKQDGRAKSKPIKAFSNERKGSGSSEKLLRKASSANYLHRARNRQKDWPPSPSVDIPAVTVESPASSSSMKFPNGVMLDVDIPSIEMERYSVMFGSVLSPDSSSSLLARRQGATDRLKPLDDGTLKNGSSAFDPRYIPQRRATSPTTKSPNFALSLFPRGNPQDHAQKPHPRTPITHRPRPKRSNTLPVDVSPAPAAPPKVSHIHNDSQVSEDFESSMVATPSTVQSFDNDEVAFVVSSNPLPSKPQLEEPTWEMVTKASEPIPSPLSQPNDSDEVIHVAQVSIARSVSISRARNQLMRPRGVAQERMQEGNKSLTPTLVELHSKNRNRPRSHKVQLVDT